MALARSWQQMLLAARQLADVQNNLFVSDSEVMTRVNDGVAWLYDLIVGAYEHYFMTALPFSLAGGVGANTLTLPADFYKFNGLDRNPNTSSVETIHSVPSFLERNTSPYYPRRYMVTGGAGLSTVLSIVPAQNAQGTYQAYYTPLPPSFPVPIVIAQGDQVSVSGGTATWTFANGNFDSTYANTPFAMSGAANSGNNTTFTIVTVLSATQFTTATGSAVNESFVYTVPGAPNAYAVPAGVVTELPQVMLPWGESIPVYAAIQIKQKREMDSSQLEQRLAGLQARIQELAVNRDEEPGQVPLTHDIGSSFWRYP